jgi:radical SAM superfamily enzyme YgiQ (UPF0313 family)
MPIIEPCIRPPAEAESILLQVTCGCSCNTCSFCGAYLDKPFRVKPRKEIFDDIDEYAREMPEVKKLFMMDGDALALSNEKLIPVLDRIALRLPNVRRVSSYANGRDIARRSDAELRELAANKLTLMYMGLESGSQTILDACDKKSTVVEMIEAVQKAARAGIATSLMVLLGLGGQRRSQEHIEASATAINAMQPRYCNFLSVMLIPGTKLYQEAQEGTFEPLDARGFLIETREILRRLDLTQTLFFANHASNYLPLEGRLPQAKGKLLGSIDAALNGTLSLKPEYFRGL